MIWRTFQNYNSHPGAPPPRAKLKPVEQGPYKSVYIPRHTLIRLKFIRTYTTGIVEDAGWSAWNVYNVGVDWLLGGGSQLDGGFGYKTECFIEVAAGIGRPWKLIWRDALTDLSDSSVSYTSYERLFMPGDSASVLYDAADGFSLAMHSAAALIPADGL